MQPVYGLHEGEDFKPCQEGRHLYYEELIRLIGKETSEFHRVGRQLTSERDRVNDGGVKRQIRSPLTSHDALRSFAPADGVVSCMPTIDIAGRESAQRFLAGA